MNTITTFMNKDVDPLNLTPADVSADDLIFAGCNICRFGGHLTGMYSINEHQLFCLKLMREVSDDPIMHFMALTHDACEVYSPIGDCLKPCKHNFFVQIGTMNITISEYEKRLQSVIGLALTGRSLDYDHPKLKEIDNLATNTESLNLRGFKLSERLPVSPSFTRVVSVRSKYREELRSLISVVEIP